MKQIFLIANAFIGIIVGAGFASGQEVVQYFTSFGIMGIFGAIIVTIFFAYIGMVLVWLGSRSQATTHKNVIIDILGESTFGKTIERIIDAVIIFTLFGVGVVMIAGAGSNLNQEFNLPPYVGTILITILLILSGMLKVDGVVKVISSVTPFLIIFFIIIAIYSLMNLNTSFDTLNEASKSIPTTLPNWFISAINYVSFNTSVGASMAIVVGGIEKNTKIAAIGGFIGGLVLGLLIMISHLSIFSEVMAVGTMQMPMLAIINQFSPTLGVIMSIIIFGMIFNTGLGMFYAFATRLVKTNTTKFKVFYTATILIGLLLSFVGFTDLLSIFYPLIGYLGMVLIAVLIYAPFKYKFK